MTRPTLVFVSPHRARLPGLPNRPAALLAAFLATKAFEEVIVVNRLRPTAFVRSIAGSDFVRGGNLPALLRVLANGVRLIEHPGPFGRAEGRFLSGLLKGLAGRNAGSPVGSGADPKSVRGAVGSGRDTRPWRLVVDAYDAWDRSPLVRGGRRRRAVTDGYSVAAREADLVVTNTPAML